MAGKVAQAVVFGFSVGGGVVEGCVVVSAYLLELCEGDNGWWMREEAFEVQTYSASPARTFPWRP